jgi:hypothetical protein
MGARPPHYEGRCPSATHTLAASTARAIALNGTRACTPGCPAVFFDDAAFPACRNTALAIETAGTEVSAGRAYYVDLVPCRTQEQVVAALAEQVGIRAPGRRLALMRSPGRCRLPVAAVVGIFICARIDDQRQRSFVTGYPAKNDSNVILERNGLALSAYGASSCVSGAVAVYPPPVQSYSAVPVPVAVSVISPSMQV